VVSEFTGPTSDVQQANVQGGRQYRRPAADRRQLSRPDSIPAVTEYSRETLLTMLRSPDPAERDEVAFPAMVHRIGSGAEGSAGATPSPPGTRPSVTCAAGTNGSVGCTRWRTARTRSPCSAGHPGWTATTCGASLAPRASACWRRPATSDAFAAGKPGPVALADVLRLTWPYLG
jgi:hypothetical protein